MTFDSVYDANGIEIDSYFYSGRSVSTTMTFDEVLGFNKVFQDIGIESRFGPGLDIEGKFRVSENKFIIGLYSREDTINHSDVKLVAKLSLREALNKLEEVVRK